MFILYTKTLDTNNLSLFSAEFILEDAKHYNFLTFGGIKVPGIDDPEEFQSTLASMKVIFFFRDGVRGFCY